MKEKITIGIFIDTFYPMVDGVISVVNNYATRLTKYANVIVFAPKCSKEEYDDSKFCYKVVRCKSIKMPIVDYSFPIPKLDRKFMKEIKKYDLDIAHIHSPFMLGKVGIKYAKKHNIPVIATMHSQFKQDFKRAVKLNSFATLLTRIVIKAFNKCNECWAVNSEVARIFYEDYHYKTMPKVMNNATEMMPLEDINQACKTINKKHNINENDKVFLFVGRINALKNVFFIAESLKIIKNKNKDFKFKMIFVGDGQDEEQLKKWVLDNKMEDSIIFAGKVTDRTLLAEYYARADLFLFPSLYDASSIVQIEAASQKVPGVFLKGAATAATITDNVNGFLCENDEEKYADKIMKIMNNEKLYKEVCENAYKDLYKNWDEAIKEVYEKYLNLIEK